MLASITDGVSSIVSGMSLLGDIDNALSAKVPLIGKSTSDLLGLPAIPGLDLQLDLTADNAMDQLNRLIHGERVDILHFHEHGGDLWSTQATIPLFDFPLSFVSLHLNAVIGADLGWQYDFAGGVDTSGFWIDTQTSQAEAHADVYAGLSGGISLFGLFGADLSGDLGADISATTRFVAPIPGDDRAYLWQIFHAGDDLIQDFQNLLSVDVSGNFYAHAEASVTVIIWKANIWSEDWNLGSFLDYCKAPRPPSIEGIQFFSATSGDPTVYALKPDGSLWRLMPGSDWQWIDGDVRWVFPLNPDTANVAPLCVMYAKANGELWQTNGTSILRGQSVGNKFILFGMGEPDNTGEVDQADVDGDGRPDLIFRRADNTFWLSLWGADGLSSPQQVMQHGGPFVPGQAKYADIDGDGRADLIFQGVDNRFWLSLSTGTGFAAPQLVVSHGGPYIPDQAQYADVNGDGKADLIFRGVDNRFWLSLSTGDGFTAPQLAMQHGGPYLPGQAKYADIDGDGRADLIFQGVDNRFWLSLSTGMGFAAPQLVVSHGGPYIPDQAQYADVNGDGKADLIFRGVDNRFWLSLSTGDGFTAPQLAMQYGGPYLPGQAIYSDIDGDGLADLIFEGADNSLWLSRSDSAGFSSPESLA